MKEKKITEFLTFTRCDEIGSGILGKVRYSRRSNAPVIRRLVGRSLRDCAVECGLRSSCVGLNYERLAKMCELLGASSLPFEAGKSKGWVYVQKDDALKKDIMIQYCGSSDDCRPGQTCYKEGSNFRCGIKECLKPIAISNDYKPNDGFMLHVGATIRMTSNISHPYFIRCCANGSWAENNCSATPVSTLPPITTSVATTTSNLTSPVAQTSPETSTTSIPTSSAAQTSPETSTTSNPTSSAAPTSPETSTTSVPTSSAAQTSQETSTWQILTSPVTTTTPIITSQTTSTPQPSISIDENDWYTLESETRKRQLATVVDAELIWKNAMTVCESNGGYLAHIYTLEERQKINDWLLAIPQVAVVSISSLGPSDDEFWVGGEYDPDSNEWFWSTATGKTDKIDSLWDGWGVKNPTAELDKRCTNLYKDSQNLDLYSLRNSHCNVERRFICERDLTNVTINDNDWFVFNSAVETREMAYIGNPTLSWEKAQEVCTRNGATLVHVYSSEERDSLESLSIPSGDKLWTGAKFDHGANKWYWWSNNSGTDNHVEPSLWALSESNKTTNCLYLSKEQGAVFDLYSLGDSNCTENNGFLCQRKIDLRIPVDSWFALEEEITLREVAFVNRLNLNWLQAQEMCEWNDGTLIHVYSDTDMKLIKGRLTDNGISINDNVWTGGKSDDVNGWVWWSEGHRSDIEWAKLSVTEFDPTIGACIVLSNQASEMLNTDCDAFHPFLCQRETGFRISENDWFQVNDRKLASVAKGSNWESASLICQANGGTLASIYNITEISTIQRELEVKGVPYPQQLWIGGLYDEKQMTWIWQDDNRPIDESLWLSGYGGEPDQFPDNACVMLYADSFRNDMCANEYSALCQIFSAGVTNLM